MKSTLTSIYYRLVEEVTLEHRRYLYSQLDMTQRLIGIIGARGTGKTTLMLQYIRETLDLDLAFYFSADHIYFSEISLFEFVRTLYEEEGRTEFFIDEIHKYPHWNQELKNLYDAYPKLHICFSGSSSIDLVMGSYDLSRRALLYHLNGLSFREYLAFECGQEFSPCSFVDLLQSPRELSMEWAKVKALPKHFKEYLRTGYYPFFFEDRNNYSRRLFSTIEKTIYEDISSFYTLKTNNLPTLKKLLQFLSTITPGTVSINRLANALKVDHKTIQSYLEMLTATGLLQKVGAGKTGAAGVRKADKIFLNNTNLYHCICEATGHDLPVGTVRETFFVNMLRAGGEEVHYARQGDFICQGRTFEIGGRNKDHRQLQGLGEKGFLVKDDLLVSDHKRTIPLYAFGFFY